MPFIEHPEFKAPPANSRIWRYMDLGKFIWMLEHRALYFARLDQIAKMDPYEGLLPDNQVAALQKKWADMDAREQAGLKKQFGEHAERMVTQLNQHQLGFIRDSRASTFINSWHVQAYESAAMWSLYLKSADGIAVTSTYEALTNAMSRHKADEIMVGMLRYLDYDKQAISLHNALMPVLHKRISFEHEKELRAVIWRWGDYAQKKDLPDGVSVAVELDVVVNEIYVAPTAPVWFVDLVGAMLKRIGLNKAVRHSTLANVPR